MEYAAARRKKIRENKDGGRQMCKAKKGKRKQTVRNDKLLKKDANAETKRKKKRYNALEDLAGGGCG